MPVCRSAGSVPVVFLVEEIMTEKCSCGAIEWLAEEYDLPFFRPLQIDEKSHDLKLGKWNIQLSRLTTAGNISEKPAPSAAMNFCPFCGGWLVEHDYASTAATDGGKGEQ